MTPAPGSSLKTFGYRYSVDGDGVRALTPRDNKLDIDDEQEGDSQNTHAVFVLSVVDMFCG